MQRKAILFFTYLLINATVCPSKDIEAEIIKADSYFYNKKYTESLKIYESLLKTTGKISSSMLLKMAFIYEGLGDYTQALYCLSLHYFHYPNYETLLQMENLAHEHRLKGYDYSDLNFFRAVYKAYFVYIALFISMACLAAFAFIFIKKIYKSPVHIRYKLFYIFGLLFLLLFLVLSEEKGSAIVLKENTYLMSSPSAGADLIKIVEKGHKVKIIGEADIWYKITWENKTAYIHKNNLLLVGAG